MKRTGKTRMSRLRAKDGESHNESNEETDSDNLGGIKETNEEEENSKEGSPTKSGRPPVSPHSKEGSPRKSTRPPLSSHSAPTTHAASPAPTPDPVSPAQTTPPASKSHLVPTAHKVEESQQANSKLSSDQASDPAAAPALNLNLPRTDTSATDEVQTPNPTRKPRLPTRSTVTAIISEQPTASKDASGHKKAKLKRHKTFHGRKGHSLGHKKKLSELRQTKTSADLKFGSSMSSMRSLQLPETKMKLKAQKENERTRHKETNAQEKSPIVKHSNKHQKEGGLQGKSSMHPKPSLQQQSPIPKQPHTKSTGGPNSKGKEHQQKLTTHLAHNGKSQTLPKIETPRTSRNVKSKEDSKRLIRGGRNSTNPTNPTPNSLQTSEKPGKQPQQLKPPIAASVDQRRKITILPDAKKNFQVVHNNRLFQTPKASNTDTKKNLGFPDEDKAVISEISGNQRNIAQEVKAPDNSKSSEVQKVKSQEKSVAANHSLDLQEHVLQDKTTAINNTLSRQKSIPEDKNTSASKKQTKAPFGQPQYTQGNFNGKLVDEPHSSEALKKEVDTTTTNSPRLEPSFQEDAVLDKNKEPQKEEAALSSKQQHSFSERQGDTGSETNQESSKGPGMIQHLQDSRVPKETSGSKPEMTLPVVIDPKGGTERRKSAAQEKAMEGLRRLSMVFKMAEMGMSPDGSPTAASQQRKRRSISNSRGSDGTTAQQTIPELPNSRAVSGGAGEKKQQSLLQTQQRPKSAAVERDHQSSLAAMVGRVRPQTAHALRLNVSVSDEQLQAKRGKNINVDQALIRAKERAQQTYQKMREEEQQRKEEEDKRKLRRDQYYKEIAERQQKLAKEKVSKRPQSAGPGRKIVDTFLTTTGSPNRPTSATVGNREQSKGSPLFAEIQHVVKAREADYQRQLMKKVEQEKRELLRREKRLRLQMKRKEKEEIRKKENIEKYIQIQAEKRAQAEKAFQERLKRQSVERRKERRLKAEEERRLEQEVAQLDSPQHRLELERNRQRAARRVNRVRRRERQQKEAAMNPNGQQDYTLEEIRNLTKAWTVDVVRQQQMDLHLGEAAAWSRQSYNPRKAASAKGPRGLALSQTSPAALPTSSKKTTKKSVRRRSRHKVYENLEKFINEQDQIQQAGLPVLRSRQNSEEADWSDEVLVSEVHKLSTARTLEDFQTDVPLVETQSKGSSMTSEDDLAKEAVPEPFIKPPLKKTISSTSKVTFQRRDSHEEFIIDHSTRTSDHGAEELKGQEQETNLGVSTPERTAGQSGEQSPLTHMSSTFSKIKLQASNAAKSLH